MPAAGVSVIFVWQWHPERQRGRIVGWGWNEYGQLNTPSGLSNVLAIAAGEQDSLALVAAAASPSFPIFAPVYSSSTFSVSVASKPGKNYRLEFKDSLGQATWWPQPSVAGDGAIKQLTDSAATGAHRFYRVREW